MSNATVASRLAFQTSTTNGSTVVHALPNGTATGAFFEANNGSDPTNAATMQIGVDGVLSARINAGIRGTGTYLPMTFNTGGSERVRIDTSGNVGIGTTTGLARFRVASGASVNAPVLGNVTNYPTFISNIDPAYGLGVGVSAVDGRVWLQAQRADTATAYNITLNEAGGNVGIGTTNLGTAGLSLSQTFNLSWEQSSTESIVNMFRQASSAATVVSNGYKRSATANGFASSYGSSWAKTALGLGVASGAITFYTDSAATASVGTDVTPTERMRIDSSGNVGIGGTARADTKVETKGTLPTSSNVSVNFYANGTIPSGTTNNAYGYVSATNTAAASFTLTSMTHYLAAQVSLGSGSAITNQYGFIADATLTGATNNYGFFSNIASGSNRWNFYAAGTAQNYFAGNTLIGTTADLGAGARLNIESAQNEADLITLRYANAASGKYWRLAIDSNNVFYILNQGGTGVYLTDGATSWTGTSDERTKTDLRPIENAASKVATLRAVTGRFKHDEESVSRAFLIAQDVQKILPEAVTVQSDEQGTLGLAYTDVIPLLVAAIKELTSRVAELEAK
jgi:hypothetical protein